MSNATTREPERENAAAIGNPTYPKPTTAIRRWCAISRPAILTTGSHLAEPREPRFRSRRQSPDCTACGAEPINPAPPVTRMRFPLRSVTNLSYSACCSKCSLSSCQYHRGRVGSYHLDKEGIFKRLCHPRNLLRPKLGVNRHRQEPIGQLLRDGKVTLPVSEVGICFLQVNGNRIVDAGSDTGRMQRLLQVITLLELDGIHMVDVPSMWRRGRSLILTVRKQTIVLRRHVPAPL